MEIQTRSKIRNTVCDRKVTHFSLVGFALTCLLSLVFGRAALHALMTIALNNGTFSYIPLIPIVSCFLIYVDRENIFSRVSRGWNIGSLLLVGGFVLLGLSEWKSQWYSSTNHLSIIMCAFVLVWTGSFAVFFGPEALRNAKFALLFLIFAIPLPEPLLSNLTLLLQQGSADAAASIYRVFGVPFLREGVVFALPGVTIRVAEECSGIRSTLALLITVVLAAHLWIRSRAETLLLGALVFPVAVIKNGLRIVTLSCLAVYVDPGFLHGRLHRYGGIPFFLVDLLVMGTAFAILIRRQRSFARPRVISQQVPESRLVP